MCMGGDVYGMVWRGWYAITVDKGMYWWCMGVWVMYKGWLVLVGVFCVLRGCFVFVFKKMIVLYLCVSGWCSCVGGECVGV